MARQVEALVYELLPPLVEACADGGRARTADAQPAGRGQLTEFGIDHAPTAQFYFD